MNGAELIAAERERQVRQEGYDSARDDNYTNSDGPELIRAALCYMSMAGLAWEDRELARPEPMEGMWPWAAHFWKPGLNDTNASRIRELTKAGALIAAEIDRLQRRIGRGEA